MHEYRQDAGLQRSTGYDQATGLGSLDVTQFVTHWNSGLPTTTTITLGPGLPFPNSLTANNLFQFDAVVAPAASGSGTASAPAPTVPTGAVNFYAQPTTLSTPTTTSPPASPTPTTTPPPILLCPLTIPIATGMPTVACPATPAQGLLPPGTYTVTAIYSGDGIFAGSESSIAVTVSAAQGQSNIVVSVPSPVAEMPANGQYNWTVPITLTNIGSVSTTLTGFTATGTPYGASAANFNQNLSGSIGSIFGTATITAGGSIAGTFETDNITPPEPVEFLFSGTDANAGPGNTASSWKTSTAVVFNGPSGTIGNVMNGASFAAVTVPVGSPNPPPDAAVGAAECLRPRHDHERFPDRRRQPGGVPDSGGQCITRCRLSWKSEVRMCRLRSVPRPPATARRCFTFQRVRSTCRSHMNCKAV